MSHEPNRENLVQSHVSLISFCINSQGTNVILLGKVSKCAKIRNRYNQVTHLTQDTNGKVTNSHEIMAHII